MVKRLLLGFLIAVLALWWLGVISPMEVVTSIIDQILNEVSAS